MVSTTKKIQKKKKKQNDKVSLEKPLRSSFYFGFNRRVINAPEGNWKCIPLSASQGKRF